MPSGSSGECGFALGYPKWMISSLNKHCHVRVPFSDPMRCIICLSGFCNTVGIHMQQLEMKFCAEHFSDWTWSLECRHLKIVPSFHGGFEKSFLILFCGFISNRENMAQSVYVHKAYI
jgi:hypothetical protein